MTPRHRTHAHARQARFPQNAQFFLVTPSPPAARLDHLHPAKRHYLNVSMTGHTTDYRRPPSISQGGRYRRRTHHEDDVSVNLLVDRLPRLLNEWLRSASGVIGAPVRNPHDGLLACRIKPAPPAVPDLTVAGKFTGAGLDRPAIQSQSVASSSYVRTRGLASWINAGTAATGVEKGPGVASYRRFC